MPIYPLLTLLEQAELPRLSAAPIALPSQFEDSTHQVFLCDTDDGPMVLKVCDKAAVTKSGFWQGINHLFGSDFPSSLVRIKHTHNLLTELGLYAVPAFVASSRSQSQNRFVLTRFLAGEDLGAEQVTDVMLVELAKHIAQLHQATQSTWGSLHTAPYAASDWSERLHASLLTLAAQSTVAIPAPLLQTVLVQARLLQETEFVPMMLDLRWDQFRKIGNAKDRSKDSALALIDLDAFVMAPRTLDLVLLEYILTPPQFALFKTTYSTVHEWPDYSLQKPCYQLLLFLMQVLGEVDVESWMNRV